MQCMAHIVKYILYIFNVIFVICGVLLITLGSIMLSNVGQISSIDAAINTQTIPVLIIILGCIVFIVSFFGCCGAIRENVCCTTMYAVFMFILFALQIALVVWIFTKRQQFLNTMEDVVKKAWEENDNAHGYPMDGLQAGFKCCGLDSYEDYTKENQSVPISCCGILSKVGTCPADVYSTKPGCRATFVDFWAKNMDLIRFAGIAVALVELVALTFACCLASNLRRSRAY